jgi:hypothetical protein
MSATSPKYASAGRRPPIDNPHRTPEAAKLAGAKFFFTGVPCLSGHVAERYASSNWCRECVRESIAKKVAEKVADRATRLIEAFERSANGPEPTQAERWKAARQAIGGAEPSTRRRRRRHA